MTNKRITQLGFTVFSDRIRHNFTGVDIYGFPPKQITNERFLMERLSLACIDEGKTRKMAEIKAVLEIEN